jgi:hypothetical protein
MQGDDDDIEALAAWAAADGARDRELCSPRDRADDEAAEAVLQRLGRDRLLDMWRGAVGSVGESLRHAEECKEPARDRAPGVWRKVPVTEGVPEN